MFNKFPKIFTILGVFFLIILSFFLGRSSKEPKEIPQQQKESKQELQEEQTPITQEQPSPKQEDLVKGETTRRGIIKTVKYVIDGDTIELEDGEKVRYLGINAPEKGRPFSTEATEENKKLVDGKEVGLELDIQSKDQYGRTLVYVWLGETMVNLELVRRGFANVYTLPPNVKYKDQFLRAEQEAREAERGLWTPVLGSQEKSIKIVNINADAVGNDNENKNGEWVEIKNTGSSSVNLNGWTLKDEANHIYTFANFSLASNTSVFIYSGQGVDTQSELYWNSEKTAIWNNSGDTAFLRDASGNLVDSYKY